MTSENSLYYYKAHIISVYDGDTFTANIDVGFKFEAKKVKLRLARVNTPEVRGEERERGLIVRDFVRDLLLDKWFIIRTTKTGKYGRYIAELWLDPTHRLADVLVDAGHAEYVNY